MEMRKISSLLLIILPVCLSQDIVLNNYFSDGMVFQRGVVNKVWGYGTIDGDSGSWQSECSLHGTVTKQSLQPVQVSESVWELETDSQPEFTVCNLTISDTLVLREVIYGDVWLCSGQSNMEMAMINIEDGWKECQDSAGYEWIRYAVVANQFLTEPDPDHNVEMQLSWSKSSDYDSLVHMSAVCYLYARDVFDVTGVPMGVVSADWGGTWVEAWSSPPALAACGVPEEDNKHDQNMKSVLWNGMINPLLRVSLKGFLWYQGERNRNVNKNRDIYNCTFPAMISDWRNNFAEHSATSEEAPFGFVQLSTCSPDSVYNGFPVIRWHQTADIGVVPNHVLQNVFMSSPLDTFDGADGYPGGIHPRYKQIAAQRLAYAGLNVAYGYLDYPQYGPFPVEIKKVGSIVNIVFHTDIQYLEEAEISGFHFCAGSIYACDEGTKVDMWQDVAKDRVRQVASNSVEVDLADFDTEVVEEAGSIAYIWRETPVKELYMLPIYSDDQFRMPTPPFKFQLE